MLVNRPLTDSEAEEFGLYAKIRDSSGTPFGERIGVVLVHGRAGNENVMWVFSKVIEQLDPIVLAPRALVPDRLGGYSWWEVEDEGTSKEIINTESKSLLAGLEKIEPSVLALEKVIRTLPNKYGVNPEKILAIGFSQGGAAIGALSLKYPELLKGVAILASFIPKVTRERYLSETFNKLPAYFMSHGTEDRIIPFEKALETKEFLEKKVESFYFHSDKVGHKISSSGLREFRAWVDKLFN